MSGLALVVAVSRNGVIGKEGGLPWHLASDLKLFKSITMGKPIIMGRKTWESLPRKPLPGRLNIVVSRKLNYAAEGAVVVSGSAEAMRIAGFENSTEVAVIGGGEIYQMFLPLATRIYRTDVDIDVDGDTCFPDLPPVEWSLTSVEHFVQGANDSAKFSLRIFDRKIA